MISGMCSPGFVQRPLRERPLCALVGTEEENGSSRQILSSGLSNHPQVAVSPHHRRPVPRARQSSRRRVGDPRRQREIARLQGRLPGPRHVRKVRADHEAQRLCRLTLCQPLHGVGDAHVLVVAEVGAVIEAVGLHLPVVRDLANSNDFIPEQVEVGRPLFDVGSRRLLVVHPAVAQVVAAGEQRRPAGRTRRRRGVSGVECQPVLRQLRHVRRRDLRFTVRRRIFHRHVVDDEEHDVRPDRRRSRTAGKGEHPTDDCQHFAGQHLQMIYHEYARGRRSG